MSCALRKCNNTQISEKADFSEKYFTVKERSDEIGD
jgi:hypothetical protein